MKRFGDQARVVATKKLKQLQDYVAFTPQDSAKLTFEKRRPALEAIMTAKHKRNDNIKRCMCTVR